MDYISNARRLLQYWRKDSYRFGIGALDDIGDIVKFFGNRALVISEQKFCDANRIIIGSLEASQIAVCTGDIIVGAEPNAPREDVYRIETYIQHFKPDVLIAVGGGSGIDAVKAANVLYTLGAAYTPEIEGYFGTGIVSETLKNTGNSLLPVIAVQTSASSGSHVTKYSNVTDPVVGQKKLIVDDAVVPVAAVFDYSVSSTMPMDLTRDGALDGIAHCLEVFFGCNENTYAISKEITTTALHLILENTRKVLSNPEDMAAREAMGLATDLGGYSIMVGGTNGAHLTSYSLVDVTSHGRACGIMNPYYTLFFAPAIKRQLLVVAGIFAEYQYIDNTKDNLEGLTARELGTVVTQALLSFNKSIGVPSTLSELPGFTDAHIERMLAAAKNPQLKMKLQNMPVPLSAESVDEYMEPILQAAKTGKLELVRNMPEAEA